MIVAAPTMLLADAPGPSCRGDCCAKAAVTALTRHPGPGYATVSGLWDDGYGCTVYLK